MNKWYGPGKVVNVTVPIRGREGACMILEGGKAYCIDPLEDALQEVGRKWTLLALSVLGNKPETRFNEAKRAIPGISARALSTRLQKLQDMALVDRRVIPEESPPGVAYALTPRGRDLRRALIPLIEWAAESTEPA